MTGQDPLELKSRRAIYEIISSSPGIHFRGIQRESGLPAGVVDYHLRYLSQKDIIVGKHDGHYKRYYLVGKIGSQDKKLMALLRQKIPRKIIMHLLLNPRTLHKSLNGIIEVSPSTLSFHLNKLKKHEVVHTERRGRTVEYWIADEAQVARALITYKKSFLDDAVDAFAETWLSLHP